MAQIFVIPDILYFIECIDYVSPSMRISKKPRSNMLILQSLKSTYYVFTTFSISILIVNSLSYNKPSRHRSVAVVKELEERVYKSMRILTCINELLLIS